jgi:hypothetical protein
MAASAKASLLNRAKAERRPFSELLQYYGMERFLYRLSRSDHAEHFVLEGALMLQFWGAPLTRATKDIDLLGRDTRSVEQLVAVVKDCLMLELEDDGLRFDPETIQGNEIRIDAKYDGVRLTFVGFLGTARIHLQVDVGFGDVITPGAQELDYPTLLGLDAPRLLGYTPETAIAEKFHARAARHRAGRSSRCHRGGPQRTSLIGRSLIDGKQIVWFDPQPQNNMHGFEVLSERKDGRGAMFLRTESLSDTVEQLRKRPFDLVISWADRVARFRECDDLSVG